MSVIILNFRTCEDTLRALRSVAANKSDIQIEMIVVDNASGDGSAGRIRDAWPSARIIELDANLGFAAGMNAGIAASNGDFLLLLNSDVEVVLGSMQSLLEAMRGDEGIGLAAPSLVDRAGRECRGQLLAPTVWRLLVPRVGQVRDHLARRRARWGIVDVEATEGAAVMIRRKVLKTVGLLDEGFFFYHEIVDWCARIREAGYRVVVVSTPHMIHACGGATKGMRPAASVELKRSEYQLVRKRLGRAACAAVMARDYLGESVSVAFYALMCVFTLCAARQYRGKLAAHLAVLRWILAGRPGRKEGAYLKLFGSWD